MKKVIFIIVTILSFACVLNVKATSYTYRVKILNNQTNLRYDPGGTNGKRVGLLYKNDYYLLKDDKLYDDVNNHLRCKGGWYHMTYYTDVDGYVCSDDVLLIKSYSSDDVTAETECEKTLSEAGIPSSYWGGLCNLKESHPTWSFKAVKVDLDWSYVVNRESECGRNYIYKGTYDKTFFDDTCTATSPGGYVAPSQTGVAYYMDPRNSFTEKYIFQFLDQSYDNLLVNSYPNAVTTILTGADFYNYHLNVAQNKLDLKDLIIAGSVDKASPIAIASKMRVELGTGTSLENLYKGTTTDYIDYYNFFNFGVTDSCVASFGTTYCGLTYAVKSGWKGVENAINGGINQFAGGYILKDQYTGYLQKFNVATTSEGKLFTHQYMTNLAGAMSEASTSYNAYEKNNLLGLELTFKIPVYNNMNSTINNSNNGAVDDDKSDTPKPTSIPISTIVTSSGYKYTSKYISGIALGSDVASVKGALQAVGGNATVSILDAKNNNKTSGIIATGDKITINNQSSTETLEVVVKGDTSGDGVINALDLLQVQKNILGTYTLTGAYLEAADTSKDGQVNALDLLQVQKSILGTYEIEQ